MFRPYENAPWTISAETCPTFCLAICSCYHGYISIWEGTVKKTPTERNVNFLSCYMFSLPWLHQRLSRRTSRNRYQGRTQKFLKGISGIFKLTSPPKKPPRGLNPLTPLDPPLDRGTNWFPRIVLVFVLVTLVTFSWRWDVLFSWCTCTWWKGCKERAM